MEHFPDIVDFQFTAKVEDEFDQIANGREDWGHMLAGFYEPFHASVERGQDIDRSTLSSTREIGLHPETGEKITARLGKYGPYVALGDTEGETKPAYANLRKGQFIETITLEEALDLFKLPRVVGNFEDKDMTAALGRFGPYIRHDSKFYSLTKEQDPHTITGEEAVVLIAAKRKAGCRAPHQELRRKPGYSGAQRPLRPLHRGRQEERKDSEGRRARRPHPGALPGAGRRYPRQARQRRPLRQESRRRKTREGS